MCCYNINRITPDRFIPGERPGTHWMRGWVDVRANLETGYRRRISCPILGNEQQFLRRPDGSLVTISTEISRLPLTHYKPFHDVLTEKEYGCYKCGQLIRFTVARYVPNTVETCSVL